MDDVIKYLEENKGIKFTEQQLRVLNHIDGPCLCNAVPGAGKTSVIIAKTGLLMFSYGIPSESILTMTYSRASANDMKERFNLLFSDYMKENNINVNIKFSTIHSFAYGVVNKYYKYTELLEAPNAKINKKALIKKLYRQVTGNYIEEDKFEELTTAISYIKNKMLDINKMIDTEITDICGIECFKDMYIKYETYKKAQGVIDFDDMLTICYDILSKNNDILKIYQDKFQYLQLDEAQDTSKIQFAIVGILAKPKNNIFYLGDTNQAIYGYRASEPSNLLNFGKMYPNGTIYFMERNFRSTKDIIEVSNEFIKTNTERFDANMYTEKEAERPIAIISVEDEKKELEYIVEKLKESSSLSDNAIIYRNNISSISLVNELYKNNIPFYIKDQENKFFSHWVISDILAFIKLSINKHDFDSLSRIYYKTNLYLNKDVIYDSSKYNDGCGCLESILKLPYLADYQKDNLTKIMPILKRLSLANGTSIAHCILTELKYEEYLEKNAKNLGYSFENLSSILTTFKLITEDCKNINDVFNKLEILQILTQTSSNNKGVNTVTLTTMHGAKGLEWENVYIMSMVEGVFPSNHSISKADEGDFSLLEEERRLCYVALTRGKRYVDLIVPTNRNGSAATPSKFIKELKNIVSGKSPDEDDSIKIKATDKSSSNSNIVFKVDDKVVHKSFGSGKVISIDVKNDIIMILFKEKGSKRLMYSICRGGILKIGE